MTDDKAPPTSAKPRKIKAPRGTRDLYPAEAARRRWLMERWREVSIRHGFEEVDGPTYEEADLYAVKSGEGILGELFQAFSGKSPEEVERVKRDGRAGYALRPEFTPTLARMYAAKANTLPKPCKWFMAGPFFRAERPQRGRLREFLQWNCDVLGGDGTREQQAQLDAELIAVCVNFMRSVGLDDGSVRVAINDRRVLTNLLLEMGVVRGAQMDLALRLLDQIGKTKLSELVDRARSGGITSTGLENMLSGADLTVAMDSNWELQLGDALASQLRHDFQPLIACLQEVGVSQHCMVCTTLARGLAYYTGTVFEVIADGERAVAGGGRYDNLIELFGGPPTPAVGFAMGDVVLSLLLQDKGLMPSDDELLGLVRQHPDVFVLAEENNEEAEAKVRPVVAMLRRGPGGRDTHPTDAVGGLHVRHSYKATKKVDKLLAEARRQHARFAVILEGTDSCVVKDLRTGELWPEPVSLDNLHARLVVAL